MIRATFFGVLAACACLAIGLGYARRRNYWLAAAYIGASLVQVGLAAGLVWLWAVSGLLSAITLFIGTCRAHRPNPRALP